MINLRIQKTHLIKQKKTFKREIEKLKKDNDDTNNKLRVLEDGSKQDSLRFDGNKE